MKFMSTVFVATIIIIVESPGLQQYKIGQYHYFMKDLTFMARIYFAETYNGVQKVCSGTLLFKNWVLTVAHCLAYKKVEDITVYHGPAEYEFFSNVDSIHTHNDYDMENMENDVGLLKLATFHNDLRTVSTPIFWPIRYRNFQFLKGPEALIIGWTVSVPEERQLKPVHQLLSDKILPCSRYINNQNRICSKLDPKYELSRFDINSGDSGSPIFKLARLNAQHPYIYTQIGILSYRNVETQFYSSDVNFYNFKNRTETALVSTSLAPYVTWILNTVLEFTNKTVWAKMFEGHLFKSKKRKGGKVKRNLFEDWFDTNDETQLLSEIKLARKTGAGSTRDKVDIKGRKIHRRTTRPPKVIKPNTPNKKVFKVVSHSNKKKQHSKKKLKNTIKHLPFDENIFSDDYVNF